jgi:hypothetical protein
LVQKKKKNTNTTEQSPLVTKNETEGPLTSETVTRETTLIIDKDNILVMMTE